MNTSEKKLVTVLMILTIVFTMMGGTLAYFNWQSSSEQNTAVTFTVASGFSCSADGGGSINNNNGTLAPASCTNTTYAFQRTIKANVVNNRGTNVYLDMWLNVNSIDSGLANSNNFRYALTTNPSSCTEDVVLNGKFKGVQANDKVYILEGKNYATTTNNDTFYLYVWLDAAETSSDTMNQNFSLTLGGECNDEPPPPANAPVLDTGMIPVKISNTGVVTTVSENDSTWYNYDNKEWANAVLVKETADSEPNSHARSYYKTNSNVTVTDSDILAYYVWIPRYSYKVWQYTGVSDTGLEREIKIRFVSNNVKESATGNNQWYTHPAFTFGNTELDGIWIGKFETSADISSTCYTTPSEDNCDNASQSPRIVPNVDSLRYQNVSNGFQTALKFAGGSMTDNVVSFDGSSTYGLTKATDSHMMKNSEWGAVAYLSHSKYGINTEIRKNNFLDSQYRTSTGCGADSANANTTTTVTTCAIPYGTPSNETYTYPQSTTGNISGVFDMSGGAWDRVMGKYDNASYNGGFDAAWFTTTGNSKYYNLYDSNTFTGTDTTNFTLCTLATCGGHAMNETKSWYSDYARFVYFSKPWFYRGGLASIDTRAGAFCVNGGIAIGVYTFSFRSVLVAGGA